MSPNEYFLELTEGGAVRGHRRWVPSLEEALRPPPKGGGGSNAGRPGLSTAGRAVHDFSQRSRNELRWQMSGLPWQQLGPRPALITLTYPRVWWDYAPNNDACRVHVNRFKSRWSHRWGEPIRGLWVREFQKRGAPHYHCYVGLPEGVADDDAAALAERTHQRNLNRMRMSKHEAHNSVGRLRGDFGGWLLEAWGGSVRSPVGNKHREQGADVAPLFWGAAADKAAAGKANWDRIAEYLWQESGKWAQKTPPEGFAPVGHWWGLWNIRPVITHADVDEATFMEVRRAMVKVTDKQREREKLRRAKRRGQA